MTDEVALLDRAPAGDDQPPPGPKRSYHNLKIQRAIDDEIAAGGSMETLGILSPRELRRRLNEHLIKRGVREKELPAPRAYQRFFRGR